MAEKYEPVSPQTLLMDKHKLKATVLFLPYAARQEEMAQMSCQMHPSVPLDSHSPLSNFALDFRMLGP